MTPCLYKLRYQNKERDVLKTESVSCGQRDIYRLDWIYKLNGCHSRDFTMDKSTNVFNLDICTHLKGDQGYITVEIHKTFFFKIYNGDNWVIRAFSMLADLSSNVFVLL